MRESAYFWTGSSAPGVAARPGVTCGPVGARRHPHVLKHSLGTYLVAGNVNLAVVKQALSHKCLSSRMVCRGGPVYAGGARSLQKVRHLKQQPKGTHYANDSPASENHLDTGAVHRRAHRLRARPREAFWKQRGRVPEGA